LFYVIDVDAFESETLVAYFLLKNPWDQRTFDTPVFRMLTADPINCEATLLSVSSQDSNSTSFTVNEVNPLTPMELICPVPIWVIWFHSFYVSDEDKVWLFR